VGVLLADGLLDVTDWVDALPCAPRNPRVPGSTGSPSSGMLRLLESGPEALRALAERVRQPGSTEPRLVPLAAVELLAPIPNPRKIVAIGRNYADHAAETGVAAFEKPRIIAKLPNSVVGPGAQVAIPAGVEKLDFEGELGVGIGRPAHKVRADEALAHVAGYTVLNDLSAREFQFDVSPPQTTFAKSMDGFCPMGPWLVTADEVADPQALELRCAVNGQEMQHASTAQMIFPVARLIEYITGFVTLLPGDVIATGTPSGVGAFRKPPVWLKPGDRLRLEVSGIGVLEHTIA